MAASLLTSTTTCPILLPCPFPDRTQLNPFLVPSRTSRQPVLRGSSSCVVRFGFRPGIFPEPEEASYHLKHLLERAEGLVYTIADAAVSSPDGGVTASASAATKQDGDWLSGITNTMESVLKILKDGLSALHVPYSYGFAIILLTVLVKALTFPLSKKQVESAMAMRSMQPQVKAIQERYAGNQEKIQLETARLYKLAGVNPFAGCLPTLATIPVWIGLYRALSNVANEGLLTEGFFWIPSLAGPTAIADRQGGSGTSWLFPFVDGHPPLGWPNTLAYLVLPVLLVVSQYISVQILQSSQSSNDPNMKNSQVITQFLPLMIGYFALSVPSGLSLYWFTNNVLSSAQQIWLQKLGGAKNPEIQFNNDILIDQVRSSKSASQSIYTKSEAVQVEGSAQSSDTKPETIQVEGSASGGVRPGERFKQIKEEEARRRRQKEEEMKSEQIEANGSGKQLENGGSEEKLHSQQDAVDVNGSLTRTDDKPSEEDRIEVKRK